MTKKWQIKTLLQCWWNCNQLVGLQIEKFFFPQKLSISTTVTATHSFGVSVCWVVSTKWKMASEKDAYEQITLAIPLYNEWMKIPQMPTCWYMDIQIRCIHPLQYCSVIEVMKFWYRLQYGWMLKTLLA